MCYVLVVLHTGQVQKNSRQLQVDESPFSFSFLSVLKVCLKKSPFSYLSSSPLPPTPMRALPPRKIPPKFFSFFSPIYLTPQDLNLFPKKEKSPISFLLLFFFKSSNQKQSSQFQIPLQNLPRRVPPSLNSNGKFPCKNMKFLKLNNCMNR